jgi:hypothetical protein
MPGSPLILICCDDNQVMNSKQHLVVVHAVNTIIYSNLLVFCFQYYPFSDPLQDTSAIC